MILGSPRRWKTAKAWRPERAEPERGRALNELSRISSRTRPPARTAATSPFATAPATSASTAAKASAAHNNAYRLKFAGEPNSGILILVGPTLHASPTRAKPLLTRPRHSFPRVGVAPSRLYHRASLPIFVAMTNGNSNGNNNFIKEDPWRIFRIMAEFVDSFEILSQVGPARDGLRLGPDAARRSVLPGGRRTGASGLAKHNLAVITGGGPGIMEAANRGAAQAKGKSVGLEHRAAARAEGQPLRQHADPLPLFLLPQGLLREIQHGLRLHAGRLRHAGRVLRGADPGADPAHSRVPHDPVRQRALEGPAALDERHGCERRRLHQPATTWTCSRSPTTPEEAVEIILDYERRVGPPEIVPKAFADRSSPSRGERTDRSPRMLSSEWLDAWPRPKCRTWPASASGCGSASARATSRRRSTASAISSSTCSSKARDGVRPRNLRRRSKASAATSTPSPARRTPASTPAPATTASTNCSTC